MLLQIFADRFGHAGLWGIGWRHAHRSDTIWIQIVKDMPLVSIDTHTAAFPSMAYLGVFDADAPIFCLTFDQTCLPLLIDFSILRQFGTVLPLLPQHTSKELAERISPGTSMNRESL